MNILDTFFRKIVFTKTRREGDYDQYIARIHDRLASSKHKYIFVFVPYSELNMGKCEIQSLNWINLQIRTIELDQQLKPQKLLEPIINPDLQVFERLKDETHYQSPTLPNLSIILRHDPKKKGNFQYNSIMSLSTALETGNCVISRV